MSNIVDRPHGYPLSNGHRICIHKEPGGRDYMEDMPVFARNKYDGAPDGVVTQPYGYVAIFDGHGGRQASEYASEHLLCHIISQRAFWSENDAEVLSAIRQGFINCHYKMWEASKDWPPRPSGSKCTAGTTASVAFIHGEKVYVGHAGDSGIVMGKMNYFHPASRDKPIRSPQISTVQGPEGDSETSKTSESIDKKEPHFQAVKLTRDHKPETPEERARIESLNGEVRRKDGVFRVVRKHPMSSDGALPDGELPVTTFPYLAIARSLGDFWSYEEKHKEFVVSPVPDVAVHCFSMPQHRCLVVGSDGLWDVVTAAECVEIVEETYRLQELWAWQCLKSGKREQIHAVDVNVAELLVRKALNRCELSIRRSDNVGVVVYYPHVSEEKLLHLLENPSEGKAFPWINDPDQGFAQYRCSLMHLQNMVSCINTDTTGLSIMEIASRIDMLGYPPRMRCNPLREQSPKSANIQEASFDIDPFIPQCASVRTKSYNRYNLRISAYDSLELAEDFTGDRSARICPLKNGRYDMLLSQKIELFQASTRQTIESSTSIDGITQLTTDTGSMNGTRHLRLTLAVEEEEKVDSPSLSKSPDPEKTTSAGAKEKSATQDDSDQLGPVDCGKNGT